MNVRTFAALPISTSLVLVVEACSSTDYQARGEAAKAVAEARNEPLPPEEPLVTTALSEGPSDAKLPPGAMCNWSRSKGLQHYRDFAALDPNSAEIWAGNVIQSKSLNSGVPERVRLPRGKGRIVMTGLQAFSEGSGPSTYARDIDKPDLGSYQDAVASILNGAQFGTPGVWVYDIKSAYESKQAKYQLGIATAFQNISGSINLGKEKTNTRNSFVMKFVQRYYTVSFDAPGKVEDFFTPDVTLEDARRYMYKGNAPGYISEVTYGRQVYVKVESNYSLDVIKAALSLSISIGKNTKGVQEVGAGGGGVECKTVDNGKTCCDPTERPTSWSDPVAKAKEKERATECKLERQTCKTNDNVNCVLPEIQKPTEQALCDAMKQDATCKGSKGCIDLVGSACVSNVMQNSYIEAWGVGGSTGDAGKIALANPSDYFATLADYIDRGSEFSATSPGAPISYKVRSVADNSLMAIADPLDFKTPDCVVGQASKVEVSFESVDLVAQNNRGSSFAFCVQPNSKNTAWTCNNHDRVPQPTESSEPVLLSNPETRSANRRVNASTVYSNIPFTVAGTYYWLIDNAAPKVTRDVGLSEGQTLRVMAAIDLENDWQLFDTTLTYKNIGGGKFAWSGPVKVKSAAEGLVRVTGKVRAQNPPFEANRGNSQNFATFRLMSQGKPLDIVEGE